MPGVLLAALVMRVVRGRPARLVCQPTNLGAYLNALLVHPLGWCLRYW